MGKTSRSDTTTHGHSGCEQNHSTESLWIFGYGSILWQTGFKYDVKKIGHIKGFERVFWQGNITHRGVPGKPGRVATLVPNPEAEVWGAAYQLTDPEMIQHAMSHLNSRECTLGGYDATNVTFYPRDCVCGHTINAVVFLASPHSEFWLGANTIDEMVPEILERSGPNGSNAEYILFIAWFIRRYIPESIGKDKHLFEFENALFEEIHARGKTGHDFYRAHLKPNELIFNACEFCVDENGKEENTDQLELLQTV